MADVTTGEAMGILLAMTLEQLVADQSPMAISGMVRNRGESKFDIVHVPEGDWAIAERQNLNPELQDAGWLVVDEDAQEITLYLVRLPIGEHEFDAIVSLQYDLDEAGTLGISNPDLRVPPDGSDELAATFWDGVMVGLQKNARIANAPIDFGGLGDYVEPDATE